MRRFINDCWTGVMDHEKNPLRSIQNIQHQIKPDIVLYDAGVDIFLDDKLGNLKISLDGIRKRDYIVLDHYRKLGIPIATVIGGGYDKNNQKLTIRHSIIFKTAIEYIANNTR